jgi:hypothetical protein
MVRMKIVDHHACWANAAAAGYAYAAEDRLFKDHRAVLIQNSGYWFIEFPDDAEMLYFIMRWS